MTNEFLRIRLAQLVRRYRVAYEIGDSVSANHYLSTIKAIIGLDDEELLLPYDSGSPADDTGTPEEELYRQFVVLSAAKARGEINDETFEAKKEEIWEQLRSGTTAIVSELSIPRNISEDAALERLNSELADKIEKLEARNLELHNLASDLANQLEQIQVSQSRAPSRPTPEHLRKIDELTRENQEMRNAISRWQSMGVRWSNLNITSRFDAMEAELESLREILGWLNSRLSEFDPYFRSQFENNNSDEDGEQPLWRDNEL